MSELIQKNDNRANIRWKLLTGVSALALTAHVSIARAEDSDRALVWIELGGQWSKLNDDSEIFAPPLMDGRPSIFSPSQKFEKPPIYGLDEFGTISFQPDNSNWVFSASMRYGRSVANRHVHQQTYPEPLVKYIPAFNFRNTANPVAAQFADTTSRNSEHHAILDFEAGKDVGLGIFGSKDATSVVGAGVRFAQFQSKSNVLLKSDPDWHRNYRYFSFSAFNLPHFKVTYGQFFHSNLANMNAERSFHGIGPSISWKASAPLVGNVQDGAIMLDWGLNAAALFGRQRARTHHQTTARYFGHDGPILSHTAVPATITQLPAVNRTRSRSVMVPNVGGFAGLSIRYSDAKISFGYKADFFFGAIDGGIDAPKKENRGFFGPFASISIGVGD